MLRRVAKRFPEIYARTYRFHLISSFLAGVLAGDPDAPIDWGNGSGTSLMDWSRRRWDPELVAAAAAGLAGGASGLGSRLPPLAHPLTAIGRAAAYFSERYGLSPECAIVAGSGDNPQSKVLASGALLSLGTSFVLMVEGARPHVSANAMYDGLGRPFLFGCRTNGALSWESVRKAHGLGPNDFAASEKALATEAPGSLLRIVQTERESFPDSPSIASPSLGLRARLRGRRGLEPRPHGPGLGALRRRGQGGGGHRRRGRQPRSARAHSGHLGRARPPHSRRRSGRGRSGGGGGRSRAGARARGAGRSVRAVAARPGAPVQPDSEAVATYRGAGGYLARLEKEFAKA